MANETEDRDKQGLNVNWIQRAKYINPFTVVFGGIFLLMIFILAFDGAGGINAPGLGGSGGGNQNGSGTIPPGTRTTSGLNYYIPMRDTSVVPLDLRDEILSSWPNAQIQNYDLIVSESIANGWNPGFILTIWVEESGAQGVGSYSDALGCDPSNPTTDINRSLSCVFNSFGGLTNERFADFMCRYGGDNFSDAPCTFNVANPNFPGNIKSWYERFVPAGSNGALIEVPETGGGGDLAASCPIAGGTSSNVTCGSFFTLRSGCGHCREDAGYANYMNICTYDAINYAEDIGGSQGQEVILPSINGSSIDWTLNRQSAGSTLGSIRYYEGIDPLTNDAYWIQFHHVDPDSGVTIGKSGDRGGRICTSSSNCNHVHVEFATVPSGGGRQFQDAPLFLCI